jgi:hypothetical protein
VVHHKLGCVSHRKYGRLFLLRKPFRSFVFASQTLQVFCFCFANPLGLSFGPLQKGTICSSEQASRALQLLQSVQVTEDIVTNGDGDVIVVDEDLNNTYPIRRTSSQTKLHRWRKCFVPTNKFMVELDSILQHFDVEEKRDIVRRIMKHDNCVWTKWN